MEEIKMEKEIYVVVKNKALNGCVGKLYHDYDCCFDDYRTNEYDVDLEVDMEQGQQIIADYLIKDLPCNPNSIHFMNEERFYAYLINRVNRVVDIFCNRYGMLVPDSDINGAYIEGNTLYVEIKVGDDILVLENDVEYLIDCKNDKDFCKEIVSMFIDTVKWFKSNKRLDDLVNANYVLMKENEILKKYME